MRLLLSLFVILCLSIGTNAQKCNPKWTHGSTYGIYPDKATNLPHAEIGVAYSSSINFRIKKDTSTTIAGTKYVVHIDSIQIYSVTGVPIGFNYNCTPATCTFLGDSASCVNVYGTAPLGSAGVYPIKVYITGFAYIPKFGFTIPQNDSITYYKLIIDYPLNVTELPASDVFISAPTPNPANTESLLNIYSGHTQHLKYILLDMTGRIIAEKDMANIFGEENIHIPTASLASGTYIVFVQASQSSYKSRLIVNH